MHAYELHWPDLDSLQVNLLLSERDNEGKPKEAKLKRQASRAMLDNESTHVDLIDS